ncbi:carbon-nitrogen hydrolase family protein [Halomonas sp. McH1-25]|uniref:carbon-nitrogen hydrolase family protein n=1 Tax=unclassified Halomonas TaxID=2609666 RepID=UPI001EF42CCC|nr:MULTISPECIES: carbon-nitrogen hydrolase family protein [unclassified Halomonas]MCG7600070.1 carbon-nitrogen hydrolase family protein [Halomonas sp. McH1-25]MCP1344252.1 carbon-nitrogen hydrolase family protein [Halomonas sp. FL8]MCP1363460.1 carbon-nitrogen hydrolase family protein [Halomonas sp. BBD45]
MQIELAQLSGREGDIAYNLDRALTQIERSHDDTQLIVFPETHLTGFAEPGHAEDRALDLDGPELAALKEASRRRDLAIAIGFLESDVQRVFNTTVLITPEDGIALRYRKTHLWPDERELVTPGDRMVCGMWRGRRIGLMVCYDIEFPETARALAAMGTELIVITNGNMDPYGPVHRSTAIARALENQAFVAMTNRAGRGVDMTFAGESAVIDPLGQLVTALGRDEDTVRATLDFSRLAVARRDYHYLDDRRIPLFGRLSELPDGQRHWLLN